MTIHILNPKNPKKTRCGLPVKGRDLTIYGPFGSCGNCQKLYARDIKNGGDMV